MQPRTIVIVFICFLGFFSCQPKSEYHKLVKKELASGERYDSIFHGIFLGMESEHFYKHCWELNKKGIIREGASNTSVHYQIKDFKYPAGMDFYPTFYEDKIVEMPVLFAYDSWSPWNRHLFSDSLISEVKSWVEENYGPGLLEIENPSGTGKNAYVMVNGNRRISIYEKDDIQVLVQFTDLIEEKKIKKERKDQ